MSGSKGEESNVPADELSGKTESRRDFTKKLAYATPVILTLAAKPAWASHGSWDGGDSKSDGSWDRGDSSSYGTWDGGDSKSDDSWDRGDSNPE